MPARAQPDRRRRADRGAASPPRRCSPPAWRSARLTVSLIVSLPNLARAVRRASSSMSTRCLLIHGSIYAGFDDISRMKRRTSWNSACRGRRRAGLFPGSGDQLPLSRKEQHARSLGVLQHRRGSMTMSADALASRPLRERVEALRGARVSREGAARERSALRAHSCVLSFASPPLRSHVVARQD